MQKWREIDFADLISNFNFFGRRYLQICEKKISDVSNFEWVKSIEQIAKLKLKLMKG